MIICNVDSNLIYAGEVKEIDDRAPVPKGWIAADPPEEGIMQWQSTRWVELASYPVPPEPVPVVHEYDKLKIVEAIDGMGKLEDFAAMMATAPLKVQMRWQAAGSLKGDDEDLRAMLAMIQQAWEKTDDEMALILAQCVK
jgi:hypothetical protein